MYITLSIRSYIISHLYYILSISIILFEDIEDIEDVEDVFNITNFLKEYLLF